MAKPRTRPRDAGANLGFESKLSDAAEHEAIVSRANGSTFLEIRGATFRPIQVLTPPTAVLGAFGNKVRNVYERMVSGERESCTLAAPRDSFLPKLMPGKLHVQDAGH